jgi:hypothetical protein
MNYKFISTKEVIGKVFRDLKPTDTGWTYDAVEWIGEALDFIGYHGIFDHKVETVTIENFRGAFPCDLYSLTQVEYNGQALVYGTDTAAYDQNRSTAATPNTQGTTYTTAVAETNPTDSKSSPAFTLRTTSSNAAGSDYYLVNAGYIVTSFEEGTIKLHYTAYPTDGDGFPMVPDNIYVKQALEWYIIRQMMMGGYIHPVFNWQVADDKWGHYCVAAQNDLAFPSIDKMETMKNMFVRLAPNMNAHADFFQGQETQGRLGTR